jgi:hypothetical protein
VVPLLSPGTRRIPEGGREFSLLATPDIGDAGRDVNQLNVETEAL